MVSGHFFWCFFKGFARKLYLRLLQLLGPVVLDRKEIALFVCPESEKVASQAAGRSSICSITILQRRVQRILICVNVRQENECFNQCNFVYFLNWNNDVSRSIKISNIINLLDEITQAYLKITRNTSLFQFESIRNQFPICSQGSLPQWPKPFSSASTLPHQHTCQLRTNQICPLCRPEEG